MFNLPSPPLKDLPLIKQVALGPCPTVLNLNPLPRVSHLPTLKARDLRTARAFPMTGDTISPSAFSISAGKNTTYRFSVKGWSNGNILIGLVSVSDRYIWQVIQNKVFNFVSFPVMFATRE